MIIGLTGSLCAGKGEVADYLKSLGYAYFSLSDALREEAGKNNIDTTRNNLIILGNKLRKEYGNGVLAQKIKEMLPPETNIIIDSITISVFIIEYRAYK